MSMADKPVLVICGPTASGKTRVGIDVAKMINGEIISADARQFYKLMDIGTAKPTLEERAEVPHHLVDFIDINNHLSAADFRELALRKIEEIFARGCNPIVVGGSGMYIKALEEGFFEGPKADHKLRRYLEWKIAREGIETLYKKLKRIDPDTADRLSPNDRARIVRALEVHHVTGKSISTLQAEGKYQTTDHRFLKVGIRFPRDVLYNRINERVVHMVNSGLVEEVRAVFDSLRPESSHLFKSLGYREFKGYLDGKHDLDKAIMHTQQKTRNYAKRQLTWFRGDSEIKWFDANKPDIAGRIAEYFKKAVTVGG